MKRRMRPCETLDIDVEEGDFARDLRLAQLWNTEAEGGPGHDSRLARRIKRRQATDKKLSQKYRALRKSVEDSAVDFERDIHCRKKNASDGLTMKESNHNNEAGEDVDEDYAWYLKMLEGNDAGGEMEKDTCCMGVTDDDDYVKNKGEMGNHAGFTGVYGNDGSAETDPSYMFFLENLEEDGTSYLLKVFFNDGKSKLLKYEENQGSSHGGEPKNLGMKEIIPRRKNTEHQRIVESISKRQKTECQAIPDVNVCEEPMVDPPRAFSNVLENESRKDNNIFCNNGSQEMKRQKIEIMERNEDPSPRTKRPSGKLLTSKHNHEDIVYNGDKKRKKPIIEDVDLSQERPTKKFHSSKHDPEKDDDYGQFLSRLTNDGELVFTDQCGKKVIYAIDIETSADPNAMNEDVDEKPVILSLSRDLKKVVKHSDIGPRTFREMLMVDLRRPYDDEECQRLWKEASRKSPMQRHRESRQGAIKPVILSTPGKSYLERDDGLAQKIEKAGSNLQRVLYLLRGFFFWLQHVAMDGSFAPWTDEKCLKMMPI